MPAVDGRPTDPESGQGRRSFWSRCRDAVRQRVGPGSAPVQSLARALSLGSGLHDVTGPLAVRAEERRSQRSGPNRTNSANATEPIAPSIRTGGPRRTHLRPAAGTIIRPGVRPDPRKLGS